MYEMLLSVIKSNWVDIVLVISFIGGLLFLYKIGKKDLIKQIILSLVVQAEKSLGSGTGELKYTFVVERTYSVLPVSIKWLITKKELDHLIEEAVLYLKLYLSHEGKNLKGYEEDAGV